MLKVDKNRKDTLQKKMSELKCVLADVCILQQHLLP